MNFFRHSCRVLGLAVALATACTAAPVITEFMASNRQTLADNEGDFSDWIEIHNPDSVAVDLTGWSLTDNATRLTKWQFPAVSIPAQGYLVVFASDKDRAIAGAPLHTNFALSADGEYLALVAADGTTVVSEFTPSFPAQPADAAFGRAANGTIGFLAKPTPGEANSAIAPSTLALNRADGTTETFTTPLPILVLDNAGFGTQEQVHGERQGSLRLISGGTTFATGAGLKVRGSSSANFPKKGYSIELRNDSGGNRSASLLGMAKVADWALVSPWQYDPSYLRNAYLYALSNSIGRWAPQTRFAEVFFNPDGTAVTSDHYVGLGVLTERIKLHSELVNLASLSSTDVADEAVTGGYILKIDPPDADEAGWVTDNGFPFRDDDATQLIIVAPKADKIAPEQQDYIQGYVQAFENALLADRDSAWATRSYLGYIDRASWIDYHLLQVLAKNPDGLVRSTYFTKDRGGKLKAGPVWDFDRAMGSTDERSFAWNEWSETYGANLWQVGWWGVLARDPDYMQAWIDRWQSLRRDALSDKRLAAVANSLAAQIDPGAAERDAARWPENASRFANHRGEVDHLIGWLTSRAGWIDEQFLAAPVVELWGDTNWIGAPAGMLVAYTLDGTDPRAPGGGLAETAATVADWLEIPAGTTVKVRIFNPSFGGDRIGSPWSSLIVVKPAEASPEEPATEPDAEPQGEPEPSSTQLAVVSTRVTLTGGDAKLISHFVVPGDEAKTFVVRAVGSTLAGFGLADALPDPVLNIFTTEGSLVAGNGDWRETDAGSLAAQFAAVGAFPLHESESAGRDAALLVTLAPGSYTLEVGSASGAAGTVLAEIYPASEGGTLSSFSAQTAVRAGETVTNGLVIGGSGVRRVLVRAAGNGIDTTLAAYAGNDLVAASSDSGDAALQLELAPGIYTLQAGLAHGASGSVRLEIVDLP